MTFFTELNERGKFDLVNCWLFEICIKVVKVMKTASNEKMTLFHVLLNSSINKFYFRLFKQGIVEILNYCNRQCVNGDQILKPINMTKYKMPIKTLSYVAPYDLMVVH